MPFSEAEEPVNKIVPFPLSTIPGSTFKITRQKQARISLKNAPDIYMNEDSSSSSYKNFS